MKNIIITKCLNADEKNFTSNFGIKVRRIFHEPLRRILSLSMNGRLIIESKPNLKMNKPYLFASTHYFSEDVLGAIASIDRPNYALFGTTNQIEHNPQIYAAWANGLIYVDRCSEKSRKESIKKMQRIINNGVSILMYPEGGWNNTENLLVQTLFSGPYILAQKTGIEVVPMSIYYKDDTKQVFVKFGNPLDISNIDKIEALSMLRDSMATLMYEQIEAHSSILKRDELTPDYHEKFMESRMNEYLKSTWTRDVWDEELTTYKNKTITNPQEVRESLEKVKITSENANIIAPILSKKIEDEKNDFKKYMHNNWKRK